MLKEDPWFATRIACGATAGFALAVIFNVAVPMLPAVLVCALMATSRGALDLKRALGGGLLIPVLVWTSSLFIEVFRQEMATFIIGMTIITYFGLLFVMVTSNRMGLMILIFPQLLGITAVSSASSLGDAPFVAMRDSFAAAGLICAVVIPVSYLVFRPRTKEVWKEIYEPPGFERPWLEAALRTAAIAPVLAAYYLWVDPSNVIYAIMALLVLVYPHRHQQRREARSRIISTATGGIMTLALAVLVSLQPTPAVMLLGIFLGVLWFGWRMSTDHKERYTHQLAMMVFVVLAVGAALGSSDPITSLTQRLTLTVGGALFALAALYLLRWTFARSTFHDVYPRRWTVAPAS